MLEALTIENLALVDRIEIGFEKGLNVLTGETGAGKSVLVNALSLLLGARAPADMIRAGADSAVVEALFEIEKMSDLAARLRAMELDVEGELVVRRVIARSGKGKATLNGQLVTLSMLQALMRGIIDITGQHEHVSLLDPEGHLAVLDAYGDLDGLLGDVGRAHIEAGGYRASLDALTMDEAEKARREDYLRFSIEEIEQVSPKAGEGDALEAERRRLKSFAELADGVRKAEGALYSDDGAVIEVVGRVENDLVRLARLDERLVPLSERASAGLAELEELARQLAKYQGGLAADPERLDKIEERLESLKRLVRKHGGSIEQVLKEQARMKEELEGLEHEEARRADLLAALEAATEKEKALAAKLSAARKKVVRALEEAIEVELAQLCMEKTRIAIELRPLEKIGAKGAETAEIMISPNPGEPLRPMKRIASGGELSRVLLALKHVLANRGEVSTFVFDEIDTGIGGAVADVLGQKLKDVARDHQIICVTHLPQVAAHADRHFRVSKGEAEGRTTTAVGALGDGERVEEVARMLGGQKITERTRSLAEEMLSARRRPPAKRATKAEKRA